MGQYMSLYTAAYNYCTSSKMHGSSMETLGGIGNRSEHCAGSFGVVSDTLAHGQAVPI